MDKATILNKSDENIQICVEQIQQGNLVAFPTETVYGLGANAFNVDACMKIYQYKKRPLTDPLIVHIAENDQIWELIDIDEEMKQKVQIFIDLFWPGPFTMVLPRSKKIPIELTAQTNLIGIRRPDHKTALKFLKSCNLPIAAPSANLFNHVSPTTAQHVYKDFHDKNIKILDDGQTTLGIESTVVKIQKNKLKFFRLGSLPQDTIKKMIKEKGLNFEIEIKQKKQNENQNCETPGQFIKHYSPNLDSYLLTENKKAQIIYKEQLKECILIDFGSKYLQYHDKVLKYLDLSDQGSFKQAIVAENIQNAKTILIVDLTEALDQGDQKTFIYFDTLYDKMIRSCSGKYIKINQSFSLNYQMHIIILKQFFFQI